MNRSRLLASSLVGVISLNPLAEAQTVLNTVVDGTYFEVSASDLRVNPSVVRVGGNNGGTIEFIGLLFFDVSGFTVTELNSATSISLDFSLGIQDNSPVLDDLAIDYLGTFASSDLGSSGVNGASANAIAIGNAPVVTALFSGAETVGSKSYDVTAINGDTFGEQYAVFRITEPTLAGHQWDIPDGTATLSVTLAPAPSEPIQFGIDFGPQQTAGWNFVPSGTSEIAAGSVIDLDSDVLPGVALSFQNFAFNNNDGTNNWPGLASNGGGAPAEFVDSVTTDLSGRNGGGTCTIIVTGLDPERFFETTGVTTADLARTDALTITGATTYAPSAVERPSAQSSGVFHSFPTVQPSSSGTLTIEVTEPAGNPIINGLLFTELPEDDTDGDGLPDDWEIANFGDLDETAAGDPDGDSLSNENELLAETNPNNSDSDGDNLLDGAEVNTHGTNPLLTDSDADTIEDFDEINLYGTNPNSADSDGDELKDADELVNRNTNPSITDSDGDGADDGLEVVSGFDPTSSGSTPPSNFALAGMTSPGVVGPLLDGTLPATTPVSSVGNTFERQTALPNVTFNQAMGIVTEPRSNNLVVIERDGYLQQVDYDEATTVKTQIFDLSSRVETAGLGGLMSVAFHPEYNLANSANRNYLYAFYTTQALAANGFDENPDGCLFIRVSRFTRDESTGSFPASSEQVLIQQKFHERGFDGFVHIAGGIVFGSDGFLYIAWGDNEHAPGGPFYFDAQRVDRVFQCALIAIDVDEQGGAVSSAPVRTLQGSTGPFGIAGTTQSCLPIHPWYHEENFSGNGYFIPRKNYFHRDNNIPPAGVAGTSTGYNYQQHSASGNRTTVTYSYDAHGDALEEHVALGLRNSWKLAADPVDGDIAMFDVGSNSSDRTRNFEEFNVLTQGGNYGWPYRESDVAQEFETGVTQPPGGDSGAPVYLGVETDPVYAYAHLPNIGRSASGGLFYRGTQLSSLTGQLIGGDHKTGRIWAVDYKSGGTPTVTQLHVGGVNIREMTSSPDGQDILWVDATRIYRLADVSASTPEPPALLSATGAFADLTTLEPRAGLISYEPIAPLWSDRASKLRYMAVPNDAGVAGEYDLAEEKILFSEEEPWQFPEGSVFVKHFSIPLDEGDPDNPAKQHKIETRFFVHGTDGEYYGFSYRWRDDQLEADLIPDGDTSALDKDLTITRVDGSTYLQTWEYPTRTQCFECHQPVTGFVLGVRSRQLNSILDFTATTAASSSATDVAPANQLTNLDQLGILEQDICVSEIVDYLTSANIADETAPLEHRVMSYLDSNCASCHQPSGTAGRADFDALLTTPLSAKRLLWFTPQTESLGLIDAFIVKPGDPENSLLYHRDASLQDDVMMPPLAKSINDEGYLDVLYRWIERIGYENFDAHANSLGVIGGLHDDADGDGLSNGLEFILETSLIEPTYSVGEVVEVGGVINFQVPVNGEAVADGLSATVQDSTNLNDWFEAGTTNSILTLGSDTSAVDVSGFQNWEVLPETERGFFRIGLEP